MSLLRDGSLYCFILLAESYETNKSIKKTAVKGCQFSCFQARFTNGGFFDVVDLFSVERTFP